MTQPTVKSAMRTLDLIEFVVARPAGVVAQEIAVGLAIPVSSLSYLLATLVERHYLERDGRRYIAGPGLERLTKPREDLSLTDRARPLVKELRSRLNETSSFFILRGWEIEAAITETAHQSLRYSIEVGSRTPLHCVSAGKAILASFGTVERERYLDGSTRERFTARTVVSRDRLTREIEAIRERGYAWTRDEYTMGISGIGGAIQVDGVPVAAISVGIPSSRFTPEVERTVVAKVLEACSALGDHDAHRMRYVS